MFAWKTCVHECCLSHILLVSSYPYRMLPYTLFEWLSVYMAVGVRSTLESAAQIVIGLTLKS